MSKELSNSVVMYELGKALANDRDNFLEVLENAGIEVNQDATTKELVDRFVENAPRNKKLLLGASYLINHQDRVIGFDGSEQINEEGIKSKYKIMDEYFNEEHSNWVGAIAGAVGEGAKLGTTIATNVGAKKRASEIASTRSQDANSAIVQGVIGERQREKRAKLAQKESDQKTLRIALIAGGGLLAIIVGIIVYKKIIKK